MPGHQTKVWDVCFYYVFMIASMKSLEKYLFVAINIHQRHLCFERKTVIFHNYVTKCSRTLCGPDRPPERCSVFKTKQYIIDKSINFISPNTILYTLFCKYMPNYHAIGTLPQLLISMPDRDTKLNHERFLPVRKMVVCENQNMFINNKWLNFKQKM